MPRTRSRRPAAGSPAPRRSPRWSPSWPPTTRRRSRASRSPPGTRCRASRPPERPPRPTRVARPVARGPVGYVGGMRTRTIGNDTVGRVEVGAIGLGLMTFDQTGTAPREQLADTVRAAVDAGVTLFDTADAYGPGEEKGAGAQGENERLIASLLDELGVRDRVFLATKGGHVRSDGGDWGTDSSPDHLKDAVDASLRRLGVDQIDLWQHHRPDPKVPYDDVIGTLEEIARSGKVRMIGLSNADPDQIRSAHKVL